MERCNHQCREGGIWEEELFQSPSPRKDDVKKSTEFVEGQDLEGTVTNLAEVKNNAEDEISENEVDMEASTVDAASTAIVDDERDTVSNISSPMSDVESTSEKEAEVTSGSLTAEGNVPTMNQIIEEATQTDVTNSNVKTKSPLEIANENVIESEVDHIVDEKQSQTYNLEEEFSAVAPTDSDQVDPSPDKISSITGSDITSNAPTPQETAGSLDSVPRLQSYINPSVHLFISFMFSYAYADFNSKSNMAAKYSFVQ
ncbi:enolase-phosphatase E [Spatholobus suberectus]|nr:enolase-phosphatase E [Spatholobus suberectus]